MIKGKPPIRRRVGLLWGNPGGPKPQSLLCALPLIFLINKELCFLKKYLTIKTPTSTGKSSRTWVALIVVCTFFISVAMNVLSDGVMPKANLLGAVLILLSIILIGIIFDILGTAVSAATETPFHSMAARKVRGARAAIMLIRNAEKVANFCNDVIGDIAGIISGGANAIIVSKIALSYGYEGIFLSFAMTGLVASLTVGGKAVGKGIALRNANNIIYMAALVISLFYKPKKEGK